jgi:hypothetical protein
MHTWEKRLQKLSFGFTQQCKSASKRWLQKLSFGFTQQCKSESERWLQKLSLDYATMHICTKRWLQKICLWIMQHGLHLSVRDDRLQTFVFGLCNMHAPASSQHRREVAECDYTLHIALKVSPLKPNHPSSSSRIPAHIDIQIKEAIISMANLEQSQ